MKENKINNDNKKKNNKKKSKAGFITKIVIVSIVIIILGICILPIIKVTILMFTYYLTSALCQPIADEKIISLLDQIGDTFKILLAILISVAMMLLIGVTLVVKISNTGLMYH